MVERVDFWSTTYVALLAEGVDRNFRPLPLPRPREKSPSSRRAWIEICMMRRFSCNMAVALLAEGVDRNF